MRTKYALVFFSILLCLLMTIANCNRDSKDPIEDDDTPEPTPEISGEIIYSGYWQGIGGIFSLNINTSKAQFFNNVMSLYVQASTYPDEFLYTDADNKSYIVSIESGESRLIANSSNILLAPNGRKYFYNDPNGGLYSGATAGTGGILFDRNGAYGSYSPDMREIAYLSADGIVLTSPENDNPVIAELPGILFPDEVYALPIEGDFFPRWSPDGKKIAAPLTTEHTPSGFRRQLLAIIDKDGQLIVHLNNGNQPIWAPDSNLVYYVSGNQLWAWDTSEETNTLIAGGGNSTCGKHRIKDDGSLLAYVREDSQGLKSMVVIDLATQDPYIVVPSSANGALSLDWQHEPYCGESNEAPELSMRTLVDGTVISNPTITPEDNATFELTLSDEDCNLEFGVALWRTENGVWQPLATNLRSGSGCSVPRIEIAVPFPDNGTFQLTVKVEDTCGGQSNTVSAEVTFEGFTSDDDTADDDTSDDDTTDDDASDDDALDDDSTDDDTMDDDIVDDDIEDSGATG